MPSRDERLAQNEILFRNVNERIVELSDTWTGQLDLVCECARESCAQLLRMTADDYERLRANPRRFAVLRGHEILDVETVVEERSDYLIVEKHIETHAQVEAADPRLE
jgi:hypothetical protein